MTESYPINSQWSLEGQLKTTELYKLEPKNLNGSLHKTSFILSLKKRHVVFPMITLHNNSNLNNHSVMKAITF